MLVSINDIMLRSLCVDAALLSSRYSFLLQCTVDLPSTLLDDQAEKLFGHTLDCFVRREIIDVADPKASIDEIFDGGG
jgi:hypothetical protein